MNAARPDRDPRPVRLHAAADLPAAVPPRRGRGAGAAVPGLDARRRSRGRPTGAGARGGCSASATTSACCPSRSSPTDAGRDYTPSPYLKLLQEHRDDFTVFSGVSHPNVDGGHPADICFLTAAPHPASSSFRNIDLARPARRRADRHADAVPVAHAGGQRRPQPVVDAHRRRDPAGGPGVRGVQPALPAGHARRDRARRSANSTPGGASWTRSPSRPRTSSGTSAPATATGSTSTSPASATWSTGSRSRAAGRTSRSRRSRPARRSTRPARRSTWTRCRSCTTWRAWPSRPTRPARSR